jgi:predicted lipid-binding transport protein (Tim44 family)
LRHVKRRKVDWIEHEGSETAVADRIGHHPPGERKKQTRCFGEQERLNLIVGNVAQTKEARISQLNLERDLVRSNRANVDLQDHFMNIVAGWICTNVELNINLRLTLPLINGGRVWIFEGQVLDILHDQTCGRRSIFPICERFFDFFGHDWVPGVTNLVRPARLAAPRREGNGATGQSCCLKFAKTSLYHLYPLRGGKGLIVTGIIIFGFVAAFLAMRLYAVLGKRTGHEQAFSPPEEAAVSSIPAIKPSGDTSDRAALPEPAEPISETQATAGIRAIMAADRTFTPENFVGGACEAYRVILEAYWKGDLSPVATFVDDEVREDFDGAIATRAAAGEVLDNRLINIERAVISGASLDGGVAHVTVRFDADIAAVTRDSGGKVIAGSLSDAVPTHDAWTFSRDIRARDPNWILTDTDEAS